jgi:hypothetical protein
MIIMGTFSHTPRVFDSFSKRLGIWRKPYEQMIKQFEQRIGKPLSYFDLALMCSNIPHIQGFIIHSPSDHITPFRSALRFHSYWSGSFLYAPNEGGHHLGTAAITKAILDFIILDKIPNQAEKQERPVSKHHELDKYFAGL